jgi:hypothetical protein
MRGDRPDQRPLGFVIDKSAERIMICGKRCSYGEVEEASTQPRASDQAVV